MAYREVNGWGVTLKRQNDSFSASLELTGGLFIHDVKVFGVQSCFQTLRVEKIDGKYCVLGGLLMGGGGCFGKQSAAIKAQTQPTARPKAHGALESKQREAVEFADQIEDLAGKGIFEGLPLKALSDIPLVSVEAPLYIAQKLLSALKNDNVWTSDFRFQIRYTIARLTRRYLVDYITLRPTIFKSSKEDLKQLTDEIENMVAVQQKANPVDSGVVAEFSIMSSLINQLKTNERWWTTIISDASMLIECYSSKNPGPLLIRSFELFKRLRDELTKEAKVERALLIDRLYSMDIPDALNLFAEIVMEEQPWETRFLALAYLEWSLHRDQISRPLLESLRPALEHLVHQKNQRVNEKLLTLLMKLGEEDLFGDLLQLMKQSSETTLNFLKDLPPSILAPETVIGSLNNFQSISKPMFSRSAELAEVKQRLLTQKFLSICGLPGMGKSTLGINAAQELLAHFEVAWYCNSENATVLEADLKALAASLKIEASAKDGYTYLKSKLKSFRKVLLILDNASSLKEFKDIYEGFKQAGAYLLLISRDSTLPNSIVLSGWEVEAAAAFMMDTLAGQCELAEVTELVEKLSCVPLALEVARRFIESEGIPISELLQRIDEDIGYFEDGEPQAVTMVQMSVDRAINGNVPDVKLILCLSALLSSDVIPKSVYFPLAQALKPKLDILRCFRSVKAYSLLTVTANQASQMNRLVQRAILAKHQEYAEEILPGLVVAIDELLNKEATDMKELLKSCRTVFDHVVNNGMILKYSSFAITFLIHTIGKHNNPGLGINASTTAALMKMHQAFVDEGAIRSLNCNLQAYMIEMQRKAGSYKEATEYAEAALETVGTETPIIRAYVYWQVAYLFIQNANYARAEEYNLKAIALYQDTIGPNHPDTATAYNSLGILYNHIGNYLKAEEYYTKAFLIRKECLDLNAIANSYNNLGIIALNKKDYVAAEDLYFKALHFKLKVFDLSHPEITIAYKNLGALFHAQKYYDRAEEYYLKTINIEQQALGPKHPSLANSFVSLGSLNIDRGNLSKGEEMLLKASGIYKDLYDADHYNMTYLHWALGNLYKKKGEYSKAEESYFKRLSICQQSNIPNLSELAETFKCLAEVYEEQHLHDKAEEFYLKALDNYLAVLQPDQIDLEDTYVSLARISEVKGDHLKAEEYRSKKRQTAS